MLKSVHKKCPQNSPQKVSAICVRKMCPQKCPQRGSTKSVHKSAGVGVGGRGGRGTVGQQAKLRISNKKYFFTAKIINLSMLGLKMPPMV